MIEAMAVLTLLSTLAVAARIEFVQARMALAAEVTARGVSDLAQLALRYHRENNRWPRTPAELVGHFGDQMTLRNRNGEGGRYRFEIYQDLLYIRTDLPNSDTAYMAARMLNESPVLGKQVLVILRPPGEEAVYQSLLRRDGTVALEGDLDMNGHAALNLNYVNGDAEAGQYRLEIRNRATELYADTIYAKTLIVEGVVGGNITAGDFVFNADIDWPAELDY